MAQTGTDEAVAELIRMVEGKRRNFLSWYNLNDQLIAVEALGETRNQGSLDYLSRLYGSTNKTKTTSQIMILYGGACNPEDDEYGDIDVTNYTYPLARGKLAESLSYSVEESDSWVHDGKDISENKNTKIHEVFESSIKKLKDYLESKPDEKGNSCENCVEKLTGVAGEPCLDCPEKDK